MLQVVENNSENFMKDVIKLQRRDLGWHLGILVAGAAGMVVLTVAVLFT
jgi:hypothetical protein